MKIVMYGNFSVDYCSEVHYAKTLESMGHTVVRLQETTVRTNVVFAQALKSDMLVWIHSHGFINRGAPMKIVLERLRKAGIPTVAYHLDLYMGLQRWKDYENSPYMQVEHFFTVDNLMADWFNENTKVKGHFLPAGVFHEECVKLPVKEVDQDVIFVGSKGYHSEHSYRPKLIDNLAEHYGDRFKHYGGGSVNGSLRGQPLNELYAKTKVVVGDTLCVNFDYPYYLSDRIFETTGRGGFIIHPYIKGIEDLFEIDKEIVTYTFGDFDELYSKIDYYLEHDAERESIRLAGHERTKRHHTYSQRWGSIIKEVKGL